MRRLTVALLLALSVLANAGGASASGIPDRPVPEPTSEELERDRLLEIAFYEAYLQDDLTDCLLFGGALRSVESTPYAVDVISGARLREFNYASLADALAFEAGLFPDQRYRLGGLGGLSSRANPTSWIRVLIDGLPADSGEHWAESLARIPLNIVRRVEIMRSPGGGFHGGAPGGVINVVTREPRRPTLAVAEIAGGSGTYKSHSYWGRFADYRWRLAYKVGGAKWSQTSAEAGLDSDGGSLDAQIAFDLGGVRPGERYTGGQIGLYVRSHYSRDGDRWGWSADKYFDGLNLMHYGAWLNLPLGGWGALRGEARYAESTRNRFLDTFTDDPGEHDGFVDFYTADDFDLRLALDTVPWKGARLGAQLEGWLSDSSETGATTRELGGALRYEQAFFEGLTHLVGALRYDEHSLHGGSLGFSLGLLQALQHRRGLDSLFVNYADGRRNPTREETGLAAGTLDPERYRGLETGLRLTRLDPLRLQLTGYYGVVDGLITGTDALENAPLSQTRYGGELELTLGQLIDPWLQAGIGYFQQDGGIRGWPVTLRLTASAAWLHRDGPYLLARAALGYRERFFKGDLTLTGEAVLSYANRLVDTAYPGNEGITPETDIFTLDFLLRARVIDFDIGLRLNNLLGGGVEIDDMGRVTAPTGFHLTISWVFYD